jgi:ergothioneine biosynthesis protein EgtB
VPGRIRTDDAGRDPIGGEGAVRRAERATLVDALAETRHTTWRLVDAIDPGALRADGPGGALLARLGRIGWRQERWCLRDAAPGRGDAPSLLPGSDAWFGAPDAPAAALPGLDTVRIWMDAVLVAVLERLAALPDDDVGLQPARRALFHEHAQQEAMLASLAARGLPAPPSAVAPPVAMRLGADVTVPAAEAMIGFAPEDGFAYAVERDAHPVRLERFDISLQAVTNAEYLQFVEDGGYARPEFWSPEAFARLAQEGRTAPARWRRLGQRWQMRWFDRWLPLEAYAPVVHVDAYEAEAWCAWAGRRLPTEAQWEHAAATLDAFDWGDTVWEWTASTLAPYPGYRPDACDAPPPFGVHRIVRGGSFATPRDRLDRRQRRALAPGRADAFVGLRSCALA